MSEKELSAEVERLRDKNRELNRRAQEADAAAADAKRCLDELARGTAKGTPWCGGNFGRALLAYHCGRLEKLIHHAWIHSGYPDCGYLQMSTDLKQAYDAVLRSFDIDRPLPTPAGVTET